MLKGTKHSLETIKKMKLRKPTELTTIKRKSSMLKFWRSKKGILAIKKINERTRQKHLIIDSIPKIKKDTSNENHWNWKGNAAKYSAIHRWVKKYKGRPIKCTRCKKQNEIKGHSTIHYANIDHKYKRNLNDYISLCARCHKEHDYLIHNQKLLHKFFWQDTVL